MGDGAVCGPKTIAHGVRSYRGRCLVFVGAHPVGDGAVCVPKTIAHGLRSCRSKRMVLL